MVLVPACRFSVILLYLTFCKPDTTLRQTVGAGPDGVRYGEIAVYRLYYMGNRER